MAEPDEIFKNLEKILNHNDKILVSRKEIEILWAIRSDYDTINGFLRVDNKILPFEAFVQPEGELGVQIGNLIYFILDAKTVEKAIKG